jgi:hypothetical protein
MVSAADHRGSAAHGSSEVLEDEATGAIKGIFDDIKNVFRVPFVDPVFRTLATCPDYLGIAWRQLHTNAQTAYFERSADSLRQLAVERISTVGKPAAAPSNEVKAALELFHYFNPKLLLAVTALRSASTGQRPQLMAISAASKQQIKTGIPEGAARLTWVDEADAGEELSTVFENIRATFRGSGVPSDFRALAVWPEYLQQAWTSVQPLLSSDEFRRLGRDIRAAAEQVVGELPFRMDLGPHMLRRAGLDEGDIDFVRATLNRFHASLPELVIVGAYLSIGAFGHDQAMRSPFPVDLL